MTTENMPKVTQPMAMPCGPAEWGKQGVLVHECTATSAECATPQRTVSRQHSAGEATCCCAVHAVMPGSHLAKGAHNAEARVMMRRHSRLSTGLPVTDCVSRGPSLWRTQSRRTARPWC
jgi:hypothetical protein